MKTQKSPQVCKGFFKRLSFNGVLKVAELKLALNIEFQKSNKEKVLIFECYHNINYSLKPHRQIGKQQRY
jgi:hypothetical protein